MARVPDYADLLRRAFLTVNRLQTSLTAAVDEFHYYLELAEELGSGTQHGRWAFERCLDAAVLIQEINQGITLGGNYIRTLQQEIAEWQANQR